MSGDRRGGNIGQMEELSRLFQKHSRNLDALIKDLNGRTVGSSEIWWGPGADRFREPNPRDDRCGPTQTGYT